MKEFPGIFSPEIMLKFPSGTGLPTFHAWVANQVGLEQILGLAGLLAPSFFEVGDYIVWNRRIAERLDLSPPRTRFGDDPETIERYFNLFNLEEFFFATNDEALDNLELVLAFGKVLEHFWSNELRAKFPGRKFRFEIANFLYDEEGLCFTFWQERPKRALRRRS